MRAVVRHEHLGVIVVLRDTVVVIKSLDIFAGHIIRVVEIVRNIIFRHSAFRVIVALFGDVPEPYHQFEICSAFDKFFPKQLVFLFRNT